MPPAPQGFKPCRTQPPPPPQPENSATKSHNNNVRGCAHAIPPEKTTKCVHGNPSNRARRRTRKKKRKRIRRSPKEGEMHNTTRDARLWGPYVPPPRRRLFGAFHHTPSTNLAVTWLGPKYQYIYLPLKYAPVLIPVSTHPG